MELNSAISKESGRYYEQRKVFYMFGSQEKSRIPAVNIVFLVSILISVVVPFLPLDFLQGHPVLQLVFSQVILVLPSVVYLVKYKLPYAEAVRFRKMKISNMLLCILLGILIQPVMTLISAISMVFATNMTNDFIFELTEKLPFLSGVFLVAIVPCVLEETVYRGVFYNEYSKVNPWKAALLSGFLFGLMHGNINQFCYATVMGIVFALVIEATGSILSTMLIHFWINAGSVVMMYVYPKLYEVVQSFYHMYKDYGNEEMATALELAMGDMTLTSSEWMKQTLEASSQMNLMIGDVLVLYGPSALVMGVLAFLVYRLLAKRNGNWERICGFFKNGKEKTGAAGQNDISAESEERFQTVSGLRMSSEEIRKPRLLTLPLIIAIVIGIAFMLYCEIEVRSNL